MGRFTDQIDETTSQWGKFHAIYLDEVYALESEYHDYFLKRPPVSYLDEHECIMRLFTLYNDKLLLHFDLRPDILEKLKEIVDRRSYNMSLTTYISDNSYRRPNIVQDNTNSRVTALLWG